jgi:hypothetical protein
MRAFDQPPSESTMTGLASIGRSANATEREDAESSH